jgi:transcriptional regulator with XRE-family HTH domain
MPGSLHDQRYAAFVQGLRKQRVQAGITQAELADRLRRPQSFVSKVERRERRLDVVEFDDWARALGVEPTLLLGMIVPPSETSR